jgi:HEAT repeat protein
MNPATPVEVDIHIEELRAPDWNARWHAAKALAAAGDARTVEPLIAALNDADVWVRWEAAQALGHSGGPPAVTALITALRDVEERVRAEAAQALAQIGDARALPALDRLAQETDEITGHLTGAALHAQTAADQIRLKSKSPKRSETLPRLTMMR